MIYELFLFGVLPVTKLAFKRKRYGTTSGPFWSGWNDGPAVPPRAKVGMVFKFFPRFKSESTVSAPFYVFVHVKGKRVFGVEHFRTNSAFVDGTWYGYVYRVSWLSFYFWSLIGYFRFDFRFEMFQKFQFFQIVSVEYRIILFKILTFDLGHFVLNKKVESFHFDFSSIKLVVINILEQNSYLYSKKVALEIPQVVHMC